MTEKQILKQQKASADASPAKSLVGDLGALRRTLKATGRAYLAKLEGELHEVTLWATAQAGEKELSKSHIRRLGDMVTLVRKVDVKPTKGRRKDLKQIDATIADLCELAGKEKSN